MDDVHKSRESMKLGEMWTFVDVEKRGQELKSREGSLERRREDIDGKYA